MISAILLLYLLLQHETPACMYLLWTFYFGIKLCGIVVELFKAYRITEGS